MMDGIGRGIAQVFAIVIIGAFLVGALIVGGIWGGINYFSDDEIKLKHKLEPIRVEIKETATIEKDGTKVGNVPDTTYVYKIPK